LEHVKQLKSKKKKNPLPKVFFFGFIEFFFSNSRCSSQLMNTITNPQIHEHPEDLFANEVDKSLPWPEHLWSNVSPKNALMCSTSALCLHMSTMSPHKYFSLSWSHIITYNIKRVPILLYIFLLFLLSDFTVICNGKIFENF
jgi:hypothetical protein